MVKTTTNKKRCKNNHKTFSLKIPNCIKGNKTVIPAQDNAIINIFNAGKFLKLRLRDTLFGNTYKNVKKEKGTKIKTAFNVKSIAKIEVPNNDKILSNKR